MRGVPEAAPMTKISIITVCFNSEATLEDTLRSVAEQSHPDIEHIVIDGKSTDGTMAIVDRYRHRIARTVSEPDAGVWDAMNKGLALATGDIIGFLNSDDVFVAADCLSTVAAAFASPDVDSCHADLVYVSAQDIDRPVRYWQSCPYTEGLFRRGWMPAHPTFYVRRGVYERLGGFDPRFRLQADFELTMRFLEVAKIRSVYLPRILVRMRMGGISNNDWRNVLRGNREAYRACRLHGLPVTPWFILRKMLGRLPQFFSRPPPFRG